MTLKGWTLPQTATGRSSIVAPPPWHYSGEIIAVDFTAPVDAVAALLPRGFEPSPDGAASVVFADWCSASDHDERVLADPAVGQYREAYVVLHALRGDKKIGRVPFIWVDSELSLLRGQIQGFPEEARGHRDDETGRSRSRWCSKASRSGVRRPRNQPLATRGDRERHPRAHVGPPPASRHAAPCAHATLSIDRSRRAVGE